MANNDFRAEAAVNYEEKCLCVFVLDVSDSMRWKTDNGIVPIDEVNEGLQRFYNDIVDSHLKPCLEVAIITFSNIITRKQQPALVENFKMPVLTTGGTTAMVDAVNDAIALVQARKDFYKNTGQSYHRPWIIMITDGLPDDNQNVNGLASRISSDMAAKKYVFMPIGVEGADMSVLRQIAGSIKSKKIGPIQLKGTVLTTFFETLSNSIGVATADTEDGEDNQIVGAVDDLENDIDQMMNSLNLI